jgi:hypothetical protein
LPPRISIRRPACAAVAPRDVKHTSRFMPTRAVPPPVCAPPFSSAHVAKKRRPLALVLPPRHHPSRLGRRAWRPVLRVLLLVLSVSSPFAEFLTAPSRCSSSLLLHLCRRAASFNEAAPLPHEAHRAVVGSAATSTSPRVPRPASARSRRDSPWSTRPGSRAPTPGEASRQCAGVALAGATAGRDHHRRLHLPLGARRRHARLHAAIGGVAPAQLGNSSATNMEHMGAVKDFFGAALMLRRVHRLET